MSEEIKLPYIPIDVTVPPIAKDINPIPNLHLDLTYLDYMIHVRHLFFLALMFIKITKQNIKLSKINIDWNLTSILKQHYPDLECGKAMINSDLTDTCIGQSVLFEMSYDVPEGHAIFHFERM